MKDFSSRNKSPEDFLKSQHSLWLLRAVWLLKTAEGGKRAVKHAKRIGDGHAIICNWHACLAATKNTGHHFAPV
jgi:hypothetical protein